MLSGLGAARVADVLTGGSGFAAGLRYGLVALLVGAGAGALCRARGRRPAPIGGLLLALAGVLALHETGRLPGGLVMGLGALTVAGLVANLTAFPTLVGMTLAAGGAWLMAGWADVPREGWIRALIVVTIVVGGTLVADLDRRWRDRAYGPVLLAVSAAGVFFTVPDTERAVVLVMAALPIALLGWPWPLASLGRSGAYAATGILVWTVAVDGVGRHSSIVGGLATLGLFLVEPAARALGGDRSVLDRADSVAGRWLPTALAVAPHLVLVCVASRFAGLRPTVSQATVLATAELLVAVVVAVILTRGPHRGPASVDGS